MGEFETAKPVYLQISSHVPVIRNPTALFPLLFSILINWPVLPLLFSDKYLRMILIYASNFALT